MDTKYSNLSKSISDDIDDEERQGLLADKTRAAHLRPMKKSTILLISALNTLVFIFSCILCGTWLYENHLILNARYRRTSSYTPIHDRLRLQSEVKRLNGTLYPPRHPSIARGRSNESDAQWKEWGHSKVIPVTAAQIRAMGIDVSTVVKLEDKDWSLGDDAYAAVLDVFHQLHCLNTLREIAYPESYPSKVKDRAWIMWQYHVDHCVDMLMQELQCSGNLNLFTHHWVADHERPFPNFSINRQCVDFESVSRWQLENSIDMEKYNTMSKPPDVKELQAADKFYLYVNPNLTNPNHQNGTLQEEEIIL